MVSTHEMYLSGLRVNQDLSPLAAHKLLRRLTGMLVFLSFASAGRDESYMNSRYVAAKLFFVLAVLCVVVGAFLFRRSAIGSGLTWQDDLNPLFLLSIPRLVPFAAAMLSAFFGLVYLGFEKKLNRSVDIPLAMVHVVSFLLAILGYAALLRFWWRVLGEGSATNNPLPLWAGLLEFAALAICFLAFVANVFRSIPRAPLVHR